MPEITNTWGVFFSLCCIVAPFIICYYIGKSEKKECQFVPIINNNHPSIFDWNDYEEAIKKSA